MAFGINPQILSNSLDRGLNRNLQREQMAQQKDQRAYDQARQQKLDTRSDYQYQRDLSELDRQRKNRDILTKANEADYLLGSIEQGGRLTQGQTAKLNSYMSELGTLTANMRAGDSRPRKFMGFKPVGGGRYAAELEVTNDDGSKYIAPATENGTSDPNDKVKAYSTGDMRANLRSLADLARIQAGDTSPLEQRRAAAQQASQKAEAEAKWQRDNQWERDKLGIQHGYGIGEINARHANDLELQKLKQQELLDREKIKVGGKSVAGKKLSGIDGTLLKALSVPAVDDKGEPVVDWNTGLQVVTRDPARENRFFKFMRDNNIQDGKQALVNFLEAERQQQAATRAGYTMNPNQGPQQPSRIDPNDTATMGQAVNYAKQQLAKIDQSRATEKDKQAAREAVHERLNAMGVDFSKLLRDH